MAALSDPRAFMGAAKERTDNMKQMGIEESGPEKKPAEEKKEGETDRVGERERERERDRCGYVLST